jgi:hypothetical protein
MTNGDPMAAVHHANIRSADQRAAGLAAVASLAASLALTGTGIIVDTAKMTTPAWTHKVFGGLMVVGVALFSAAAIVAVTGHRMKQESRDSLEGWGGKKHSRLNKRCVPGP